MNGITILGIIFISFGALGVIWSGSKHFKLSKKLFVLLTISFVIIQGIGIALSSVIGPRKQADKKEVEFINKMEKFSSEVDSVKAIISISDSSKGLEEWDHVIKLNREFEDWANNFIEKKDSLRLSIQKSNIKLEEDRLYLNRKWRPVYNNLFEHLSNLLIAYNSKVENKVTFNIPAFPNNLTSYYNGGWEAKIEFSEKMTWEISSFLSQTPSTIPILPNINVFIVSDFYKWEPPEISVSIDPYTSEASIIFRNDEIKVQGFKTKYNLAQNPKALNDLFHKLIEYELAQL